MTTEGATENGTLTDEERTRVLSARRIQVGLFALIVTVVVLLSAIIFLGVGSIFDWLTPSMQYDLEKKAQRGAIELAQTAQLGLVVRDDAVLRKAAQDYVNDSDVLGLAFLSDTGEPLFGHGHIRPEQTNALLAQPPGRAHDLGDVYAAWAKSQIESVEVGRVVLVISKARLQAGAELRRDVLTTAAVGVVLALILALLFVRFYIGPILRVTQDAFLRLERTTEAALAAAKLKSEFLANMSHEIRTPMNGIIGVIDLLNRTALTTKQQRYAQTIESSARSLLTIIDDILDFSKLEAGKYTIRADELDVQQLVQEVAELLAPRAHGKGIELVQRVDPNVPASFRGDFDRLKQVLTNLVGNAIKFTERGHVLIRVAVDAREGDAVTLKFVVEDTGIGISEDNRGRLFGVFSQVDGSLTRKYGGTGLGLAICKRLVEAMHGTIGMHSTEGRGSEFWFTVRGAIGTTIAARVARAAREARVLIVSPDVAERDALCDRVASWGMRFAIAERAEDAFARIMEADAGPFDAMVLDAAFQPEQPECQRLLDLCAAEALPVVRLLWTTQRPAGSISSELGPVYLTKPVRASELYNGLISLIDGIPLLLAGRDADDAQAQSSQPTEEARRAMVLVVDDNEINRLVAVDLLTEFGYRSDTACNGREALEKARAGTFAAILMDCQMPEMDGYEATQKIRELPEPTCRVPIIALTAHAMAGDREKVLSAGMSDYTSKPVRARALERVLARWIRASDQPPSASTTGGHAPAPITSPQPPAKSFISATPPLDDGGPELDPTIPRSPTIVAVFLRTTPPLLADLAAAVGGGDVKRVRELSHKLKGGCLSLGTVRMAQACQSIERAASEGHIDAATHARLPELYERTRVALEPLTAAPTAPA
jgi:signal transduction histidine kinase/CheY-like chemotaxis protein/HPt (histidine-containing phosphotransfer) domain-containing protein